MTFPYNAPDGSSNSPFPSWDTLHSPLDTPPSSGTFNNIDLGPQETAPIIDNTPILLHHPTDNPQPQQRHRPMRPNTPSTIHPIDALIFSRPASATGHPMGIHQLLGRSQPFASSSPDVPTPASTPAPSSSSKPQSGPVRTTTTITRSRTAAASSHPYLRHTQAQPQPQGSSSSSQFIPPTQAPSVMTRSKARKQSVKFADAPTTSSAQMTHHGHGSGTGPMQPTGTEFFETTASQQQQQHPPQTSSRPSPQTPPHPPTHPKPKPKPKQTIPPHRLTSLPIQTDMSYSLTTHTLSCSLELPGVHPSHLRVSLGTCYFNHVKYVGIVGEAVPVFGRESVLLSGGGTAESEEMMREEEARKGLKAELERGIRSGLRRSDDDDDDQEVDHIKISRIVNPNLRERRFGILRRFIQVPSHTTPKDITATLKHGILSLQIYCGAPFEQDDEEEVPVAVAFE